MSGCSFLVNFIADDKVVIDSAYRADYDSKSSFYNVIDFTKLEQEEKEKNYEKELCLKFIKEEMFKAKRLREAYKEALKRQNITDEESNEDYEEYFHSSDDAAEKDEEENCKIKYSLKSRRSIAESSRRNNSFIFPTIKLTKSVMNFNTPKSILKRGNSSSTKLPKRVSFGDIHISY